MINQDCWQAHDRHNMMALLRKLTPAEGFTHTMLDDVKLMRWNRCLPRNPVLYEPSIVVVCSGQKIGYLGQQVFHYNPQHFLVLSIPLPFESETIASEEEPLLAISIRINISMLSELIMVLDQDTGHNTSTSSHGIVSTPLDCKLSNAVLRLLQSLDSATDTVILGNAIIREIHYRALTSNQGESIRALLTQQNHFRKIGKALRRIHSEYSQTLSVPQLAAETGMSIAAFHASFKAVTATSPMQYLKTTRLHKARLMLQDGMTATQASSRVGYESASQFSREFKRLFGRTPVEDATALKQSLITMPYESPPYITLHQSS